MSIEAVILDFGDTLATIRISEEKARERGLRRLYKLTKSISHPISLDDFRRRHEELYESYRAFQEKLLIEVNARNLYAALLNDLNISVDPQDEIVRRAILTYYNPLIRGTKLYPDTLRTLKALKKEYKLGLISNAFSDDVILEMLRRLKIKDYFDAIVVSAMIGLRKPSPQIFNHTLKILKVPPSKAIFVGDSIKADIHGAQGVGMKAILVTKTLKDGEASPDARIKTIGEVLNILKGWQDKF